MDEPVLTPEQEEAIAEDIRREHTLEREIQPVGFIPATKAQETLTSLTSRGLDPSNMEQFNAQVNALLVEDAEKQALRDQQREAYDEIVDWLKMNRPMRYFVPNAAQEKALEPLKNIDVDVAEVLVSLFAAANFTGKTVLNAVLLGGMVYGQKELSPFMRQYKIFEKMEKVHRTERRRLKFRLLTHAAAMEDGGLMMEEIAAWWPKGLYKWEKNHKSYNSICKCWDDQGKERAIVQVRTQDQPRVAHAGDTLDGIVADEPFPKHLWSENKGRLRQRMGGIFMIGMSPLDDAAWVQELLADDPEVSFTNATVWDNCRDWHPDPLMWSGKVVGSGKVLTRGHVARKVIESHIRSWEKEGPEIAAARALGLFTHMAGAVFKEFDRNDHVIQAFPIPSSWPIYCTIDPHDAKPDFVVWAAQDPNGTLYFFGEHPGVKWTEAKGGSSFQQTATAVREMESKFRRQVLYRQGDPKRLESPVAATTTTTSKRKEFAKEGLNFNLADNNVSVGTSRVRSMLLFDRNREGSRPQIFFMETNPFTGAPNTNMITCMSQLAYKKGYDATSSERDLGSMIREAWKDPFDCIRYTVMSIKPFQSVESMRRKITAAPKAIINRVARDWM